MIKALIRDFDGIIVTQDMLSVITDIVGKKEGVEQHADHVIYNDLMQAIPILQSFIQI